MDKHPYFDGSPLLWWNENTHKRRTDRGKIANSMVIEAIPELSPREMRHIDNFKEKIQQTVTVCGSTVPLLTDLRVRVLRKHEETVNERNASVIHNDASGMMRHVSASLRNAREIFKCSTAIAGQREAAELMLVTLGVPRKVRWKKS